jgi:tetratricopeptide (TPR) repeat protein
VARALFNRGVARQMQDDYAGAITDYTAVVELADAPVDQVARALFKRGVVRQMQDDYVGAMADYTAVVEPADAPVDQVAKALFIRGVARQMQDDRAGAIADYTAVVELADAPVDLVAKALFMRGVAKGKQDDYAGAIADYNAVVQLAHSPLDVCVIAGGMALRVAVEHPNLNVGDTSVDILNQWIEQFKDKDRTENLISFLVALAEPDAEQVWIYAYERLVQVRINELPELEVLGHVATVLKTGDETKLDPLPPEQSDFVLEVLKRFKDSPEDE